MRKKNYQIPQRTIFKIPLKIITRPVLPHMMVPTGYLQVLYLPTYIYGTYLSDLNYRIDLPTFASISPSVRDFVLRKSSFFSVCRCFGNPQMHFFPFSIDWIFSFSSLPAAPAFHVVRYRTVPVHVVTESSSLNYIHWAYSTVLYRQFAKINFQVIVTDTYGTGTVPNFLPTYRYRVGTVLNQVVSQLCKIF